MRTTAKRDESSLLLPSRQATVRQAFAGNARANAFTVGLAAALGAAVGLKAGIVRYRAALLMSVTGMLLSPFGVWLVHRLDNRWLSILFSIILFFIAYRTFRQAKDHSTNNEGVTSKNSHAFETPIAASSSGPLAVHAPWQYLEALRDYSLAYWVWEAAL